MVQAGSTTTRGGKFKAVKFHAPFPGGEPVVISQVQPRAVASFTHRPAYVLSDCA
jgi:hypothetical protein